MLDERFVIIGMILSFIGGFSYLVETIKGRVKPNKVTWFLWALAPLIAFAAEVKQGVGWSSLMTFSVGFSPLLIFLASFINKKSYWKVKKRDIFCGVLSIFGLILWYITKVGNIAIFFSLFADAAASVPTGIKSFYAPETEDYKIYMLAGLNAGITLLTIKVWNFAHFAFPVYIFVAGISFAALIKFQIGRKILSVR